MFFGRIRQEKELFGLFLDKYVIIFAIESINLTFKRLLSISQYLPSVQERQYKSEYRGFSHEIAKHFHLLLPHPRIAMSCFSQAAQDRKDCVFIKSRWELGNLHDEPRWHSAGEINV